MPKPENPTHLVEPDADRTRCGIRTKDRAALPYVRGEFVEEYRALFEICPNCDRPSD